MSTLKKVIEKAHGPMNVGRIIVRRLAGNMMTVEMQDDDGWTMHKVGPIEVRAGDSLTLECPKEKRR